MPLSRRTFLKSAAAAGALAAARPWGALAQTLEPAAAFSTSRASRLFGGTRLVHADLHNHTLFSDGDGDPELAYQSMRTAGLDVAALTDHATLQWGMPVDPYDTVCASPLGDLPGFEQFCSEASALAGINEAKWTRIGQLADLANRSDQFIALRGFEWSSPTQGHMNVWFSQRWIDPLHTGGGTLGEGAPWFLHDGGAPIPPELIAAYDDAVRTLGTGAASMQGFYSWLQAAPDRAVLGGGRDGLASFNHPGREPGRFGEFLYKPGVAPQVVALEMFNRRDDYLFEGTDAGRISPLNACLNAGWRVGISGVTDEHSPNWGFEQGKGRTGLWINRFNRDGVRLAMQARRFFATREAGLRVDASAKHVQMGKPVRHSSGPVTFRLDIDRGPEWYGKALNVQVLRPGDVMPEVAASVPVVVPTDAEPVIMFSVPLAAGDGDWVVLRITDPSQAPDGRATGVYASAGRGIAYTSPWWLEP